MQRDAGYSPKDNLSTVSFHAERTILAYNFSHEYTLQKEKSNRGSRIQQAFYSLIPQSDLPAVHLKLSRVLNKLMQRLQESDENALVEATIFVPPPVTENGLTIKSICNHVNQCLDLIASSEERVQYASLNNLCGEKYLNSAAFEGALTCIRAASQLLQPQLENLAENAELARSVYLNLVVSLYR